MKADIRNLKEEFFRLYGDRANVPSSENTLTITEDLFFRELLTKE